MNTALHIYGQNTSHGEAYLVGDIMALTKLRDAINVALRDGDAATGVFAEDGEGYTVYVMKRQNLDDVQLPYTDGDWEGKHPSQLITPQHYRDLHEGAWKGNE